MEENVAFLHVQQNFLFFSMSEKIRRESQVCASLFFFALCGEILAAEMSIPPIDKTRKGFKFLISSDILCVLRERKLLDRPSFPGNLVIQNRGRGRISRG